MSNSRLPHRFRALAFAAAASLLAPPATAQTSSAAAAPNLISYRGLGTWIDIYDRYDMQHPVETATAAKAKGVRTIYVETANFKSDADIVFRVRIGQLIEAAHARGIKVVAWYLPGFDDLARDLRRSKAAIDYRSPKGQRFDSFALDIESSEVPEYWVRTERALQLSRDIRSHVGTSYPLGGIIPSPRGMELLPEYWPDFPYNELAAIYDVILPMTYWSYRVDGERAAHDYITRSVYLIRTKSGKPSVRIHAIGGIADQSPGVETRGFVHAVRERGLLGGSLYDWGTTTSDDWSELQRIPANPPQDKPLPLKIDAEAGAFGFIPGGDRQHPKDVVYQAAGKKGAWKLEYELFDVSYKGEVTVWVNWTKVRVPYPTAAGQWSERRSIDVADALLSDAGPNVVHFTAEGSYPSWRTWGVRAVKLVQA